VVLVVVHHKIPDLIATRYWKMIPELNTKAAKLHPLDDLVWAM
jgi:hypothetical protein